MSNRYMWGPMVVTIVLAFSSLDALAAKPKFGPTPEREAYIRETMAPYKVKPTTPQSPGNNKDSPAYVKAKTTCQAVASWKSSATCPYYCLDQVDATATHWQFTSLRPLNSTIDRWEPNGWDKECLNTTLGYHNCSAAEMATAACVYRNNRRQ